VNPQSSIVRAMALLLFMAPAISSARYLLDINSPWTYSVTGTETAASIGISHFGNVYVAGNRTLATRDVVLLDYSNTVSGLLIGSTIYDPSGTDDGIPVVKFDWHLPAGKLVHDDVWLSFTRSHAGQGGNMYFIKHPTNENFLADPFPLEFDSGYSESLSDMSIQSRTTPDIQDPSGVGTVNIGGQDMLEYAKFYLKAGGAYDKVSATGWDPGGSPIYGKACVRGEGFTTWAVGQTNGGILLLKFLYDNWTDAGGDLRPVPVIGFPVFRPEPQPVEVRSAVRDVMNNLWVVGKRGGIAAAWKFSSAGALSPGFPVTYNGTGDSSFNGVALDEEANAFAVGKDGEDMLLAGINQAGGFISTTLYDVRDIVEGNGICIGPDRSVWIAATITATPASTIWTGSQAALFRYVYSIDPSPAEVEDFILDAPLGGLLNLAKRETMPIIINPPRAGDIKVTILTMRGEVIRDYVIQSGGGRSVSVVWDGRNSAGEYVAAGVYAVRVTGGGVKRIKRAAVIRSLK